jgi:hypothetical protein
MMKWSDNCATNGSSITLGNVLVYANYASSTITPVGGTACTTTKQGSLNHFEIQVSQQHLDILESVCLSGRGCERNGHGPVEPERVFQHHLARRDLDMGFDSPVQRRHVAQSLLDADRSSGDQHRWLGWEHRAACRRASR